LRPPILPGSRSLRNLSLGSIPFVSSQKLPAFQERRHRTSDNRESIGHANVQDQVQLFTTEPNLVFFVSLEMVIMDLEPCTCRY
jgi:hypothetical protein